MLKSFWFYFYSVPVLLGIFSFYQITQLPPSGRFKDALEYCKSVDNEIILSEGTEQDYCIDNFMLQNFTEGFVWTFFILIGLIFLIPFIMLTIYHVTNKPSQEI